MNPKDFRFHKEHDWVRVEGDIAAFGVTDYAQKTLGDIVYVELPEVGTEVAANDSYAEVESVKAVSDVISPLSGIVVEINEEAVDAPEIINKSPYDEGWLVRVIDRCTAFDPKDRYQHASEVRDALTGRAARRQVPPDRHPALQLHQQRAQSRVRADPVPVGQSASPYPLDLPV